MLLCLAGISNDAWINLFGQVAQVVVAVGGWWFVHRLEKARGIEAERREVGVKYLIVAYRELERLSNQPRDVINELSRVIADIQLFGSPKEAELATEVARSIADTGGASLDKLLQELHSRLREELGLEAIAKPRIYLRSTTKSS
ncbi:MAG: hypothetical protein Q8L55_02395 [Phycisphaerales bacterium]|nr:hypothetical protein [Phycisphaerales bacterium]